MTLARRALVLAVVFVACVGCDQATKALARATLPAGEVWGYLGDTLRLELAHNEGGFLSLGASLPRPWRRAVLLGGVGALLLAMLGYGLFGQGHTPTTVALLGLMFAGGVSNLVDRVVADGRVTDFLNVGVGGLRTGIFNVADMAILGGAVAFLLLGFRKRPTGC